MHQMPVKPCLSSLPIDDVMTRCNLHLLLMSTWGTS